MPHVPQLLSVVVLIIMMSVVGCASIPTQEMSDARQAIKAARNVKAEYYVPTHLAEAEQNLTQAERHLEAGQFQKARLGAILAKEQAVNAHKMTVALERANQIWQETVIIQPASLTEPKTKLLEQALHAARQNDIEKTIAFAEEAYRQGQLALNQAWLDRSRILINEIKIRKTALSSEENVILNNAIAAYFRNEGKKAYDLVNQLQKN